VEKPALTIARATVLIQPMIRLAVIAAFCLLALPAQAAQCRGSGPDLKPAALCSVTFNFSGKCGKPVYSYPNWDDVVFATGAWEISSIVAADAIVTAAKGRAFARIFAGNSYNADAMTPERYATGPPIVGRAARLLGFGGTSVAIVRSEEHFPEGLGTVLPAGQPMQRTHLDVHLTCLPEGATYAGSLSVWYMIEDPAKAAAAAQ